MRVPRRSCYFSGLLRIQGRHVRAARALLNWTQSELARKADVAHGTIKKLERYNGAIKMRHDTVMRILECLERAGVEFLNEGSPGVRLKPKAPRRKK